MQLGLDGPSISNQLKPVKNSDIAKVFQDIADLLELKNENPFKIRAYQKKRNR